MNAPILPLPYPLAWPEDWKRTRNRQRSRYTTTFIKARDELVKDVRLLGARKSVITSNMGLRNDGLPLASQRNQDDPGVALWWIDRRGELRAMACDQWDRVHDNVRALGLSVAAIRSLERAGASQILDRAEQSFAVRALPAGRPWWFARLGLTAWPPQLEEIDLAFKALAKVDHPDAGGTHERFIELGVARVEALKAATGGAR